jgi:O-methyltransferase involved in polyketide biosynthesis
MQVNTDSQEHIGATPQKHFDLGRTSEQRSAEIVAALRAVVEPSPEANALSSMKGRAFARFLLRFVSDKAIINATPVRQLCMTKLLQRILRKSPNTVTVLEVASGFSARGLRVARDFPQVRVVEVDLPAVVEEKRQRLERAGNIHIPSNISWISADLSKTPLDELLEGREIAVVMAEGLLPYFTPAEIKKIAAGIYPLLSPGGRLIADIVNTTGWTDVQNATGLVANMLAREIGKFSGVVGTAEEAEELFRAAGYQQVKAYHQAKLAREFSLPVSADTSFLVTASKNGG